jgi:shikimate kinase
LWDRNQYKSDKIASDLGISAVSTAELFSKVDTFDFIISTIPPNSRILKELIFSEHQTIFDTVYHNSFFEANQPKFGYQLIKGEKWLINQALLAFELFASQKGNYSELANHCSNFTPKCPKAFVLVGFPGSGKSALGEKVAKNLYCNFIDLDSEIEKEVNSTINEIFMKFGEKAFRYRESEILKRVKSKIENNSLTILSVGGGILENPENIEILREIGVITWIYSPFDVCYSRIAGLENRPLIRNKEGARELFEKRKESYFANSENIFINIRSIEEAVLRLQNEISRII